MFNFIVKIIQCFYSIVLSRYQTLMLLLQFVSLRSCTRIKTFKRESRRSSILWLSELIDGAYCWVLGKMTRGELCLSKDGKKEGVSHTRVRDRH